MSYSCGVTFYSVASLGVNNEPAIFKGHLLYPWVRRWRRREDGKLDEEVVVESKRLAERTVGTFCIHEMTQLGAFDFLFGVNILLV